MRPENKGVPVSKTTYVDDYYAANSITRRGHTGFIILLNRSPIIWYIKIQNTVEASTFSSEFIADRTCVEHITALRFKLCMFGIPAVDSTKILFDNASVVKNYFILSFTLNKKHISIVHHFVRWHVAAGVIKVAWIDNNEK